MSSHALAGSDDFGCDVYVRDAQVLCMRPG